MTASEALETRVERTPDTLAEPQRSKVLKPAVVASGTEQLGSRIFLYQHTTRIKSEFSQKGTQYNLNLQAIHLPIAYIVPSDYILEAAEVKRLHPDIQGASLLTRSGIFPMLSIDELNVKFVDKLLPPFPIETKDYQGHKPRLIGQTFDETEQELLVNIVMGLKS